MKYWDHKRALKESVKAQRDIVNISVFDAQQTHLILEPDDQDLPTCWPIKIFLTFLKEKNLKMKRKKRKMKSK